MNAAALRARPEGRGRQMPSRIQAALNDARPKVLLPGDDRLMSDVAAELGEHLADRLYVHNSEIVTLESDLLRPIDAQTFRTLVEQRVICCRKRASRKEGVVTVDATMTAEESRGILKSPQFREELRHVTRINTVRLPAIRENGSIELLPEGYDEATQTLTVSAATYADDMPFASAIETIQDLFSEFQFADGSRSKAVSIAALVSLYSEQLVPEGELRPAFTYAKNAEGAGGTTCAACAIVPVVGYLPTGVKAGDDDEVRKLVSTAVREGRSVLLLDNVKGRLDSAALEALVSSPTWNDRLLGVNESVSGPNNLTVFVTANGLMVSPDWRRRSLFIELHLSAERAEDQTFKRPLSVPILKSMRPGILAGCWSLVRHWDAKGRPQPSRSHSAFPAWAGIIGGIVETAGLGCPLETAEVSIVADEDGDSMRSLVQAMEPGKRYPAHGIAALCRQTGAFLHLVADSEEQMDRSAHSAFGKTLARYDRRQLSSRIFKIEGKGKKRRFQAVVINGGNGLHGRNGVSPSEGHICIQVEGRKTVPTVPTVPTDEASIRPNGDKRKNQP